MQIKRLRFSSIFFLIILSVKSFSQEIPKLRIDPSKAYGGKISEYVDSIEYIPLETTKESLLGDISQMVFTDSGVVVCDNDTRCTFFFSHSGKYKRKIQSSARSFPSVMLDKMFNRLILSDYDPLFSTSTSKYYTLTGEAIAASNKITFDGSTRIPLGDGYFVSTNSCYFPSNEKPKDSIYWLVNIFSDTLLYKRFLPYNQKEKFAFCALGGTLALTTNNVITNHSLYLSTPSEHILYKISKDTALKMYRFVFPQDRSIPEKMLAVTNQRSFDSLKQFIDAKKDLIVDVRNIFFKKNFLFFKLNTNGYIVNPTSESQGQYNFIYDTLTGRLESFERMTSDSLNYYLPFLGNGVMSMVSGLSYSNGYFYSSISSLQMFDAFKKNKFRNPQYPSVLQRYFLSQNRRSNPVIVKMKLKE